MSGSIVKHNAKVVKVVRSCILNQILQDKTIFCAPIRSTIN